MISGSKRDAATHIRYRHYAPSSHKERERFSNRVHFTRCPPEYHHSITGMSPKYQISITQILEEKWTLKTFPNVPSHPDDRGFYRICTCALNDVLEKM
jgi:hypothetical protein